MGSTGGGWGRLPWVLLALGCLWSLILLVQVPAEVFYSGDSGLKTLYIQQLARGEWTTALNLPADALARKLWSQGYYPFGPPFVYMLDQQPTSVFPLAFLVITAPFYALLGYHGLYVLPLLGLWTTWLCTFRLADRLLPPGPWVSLTLFGLIFASPLTLYGTMVMEHTVGVALALAGIVLLLPLEVSEGERSSGKEPAPAPRGRARGFLAGLLVGLSALFRPEMLALAVCLAALLVLRPWLKIAISPRGWVALGLGLALGGQFAWSMVIWGHPLGGQANQVLEVFSPLVWVAFVGRMFGHLGERLLLSFPLTVFLLGAIPYQQLVLKRKLPARWHGLLFLTLAFYVTVHFLLPNPGGRQWGPRFLLLLMPLASLLVSGVLLDVWRSNPAFLRTFQLTVYGCLLVMGTWQAVVNGSLDLIRDYRNRIHPVLEALEARPERRLAVPTQYYAQELEALFQQGRTFFLTPTPKELATLTRTLAKEGEPPPLFLTERGRINLKEVELSLEAGTDLKLTPITARGVYQIWRVEQVPRTVAP